MGHHPCWTWRGDGQMHYSTMQYDYSMYSTPHPIPPTPLTPELCKESDIQISYTIQRNLQLRGFLLLFSSYLDAFVAQLAG